MKTLTRDENNYAFYNTYYREEYNYVDDSLQKILNQIEHNRSYTQKRKVDKTKFIQYNSGRVKEKINTTILNYNLVIKATEDQEIIRSVKFGADPHNMYLTDVIEEIEEYKKGQYLPIHFDPLDDQGTKQGFILVTLTNVLGKRVKKKIYVTCGRGLSMDCVHLFIDGEVLYVPDIKDGHISLYSPTGDDAKDMAHLLKMGLDTDSCGYSLPQYIGTSVFLGECPHGEHYGHRYTTHFGVVTRTDGSKCVEDEISYFK